MGLTAQPQRRAGDSPGPTATSDDGRVARRRPQRSLSYDEQVAALTPQAGAGFGAQVDAFQGGIEALSPHTEVTDRRPLVDAGRAGDRRVVSTRGGDRTITSHGARYTVMDSHVDGYRSESREGWRAEVRDTEAMAAQLRQRLTEQRELLADPESEERVTVDPSLAAARVERRHRIEQALAELEDGGDAVPAARLSAIAQAAGVELDDHFQVLAEQSRTRTEEAGRRTQRRVEQRRMIGGGTVRAEQEDSTTIRPLHLQFGRATDRQVAVRGSDGSRASHRETESRSLDLRARTASSSTGSESTSVAADGSSVTETRSRADAIDLSEGQLSRSRSSERRVRGADGRESRRQRQRSTQVGTEGFTRTETRVEADHAAPSEDGTPGAGTTRTSTRSTGATLADDGTAMSTTSGSRQVERRHADGSTTTVGVSGSTSVGQDRVEGQADLRVQETEGGVTAGVTVSPSGKLRVQVSRIEGTNPPRFQLVVTLSAAVRARGTLGTSEAGSTGGRGHASANAGGSLTFRHRLSAEETRRYIREMHRADRGVEPEWGLPEFRALLRSARATESGGDASLGDVVAATMGGSLADMAELSEGDAVELTTEAGFEGGAGADAGSATEGVGVSASMGTQWQRKLSRTIIMVDGQRRVRIAVDLEQTTTASGDARVAGGGASAGAGGTITRGTGEGVTMVLDPTNPSHAAIYAAAVDVSDRAALRRLRASATRLGVLGARRESTTETDASRVRVAAGAVGIQTGDTSTYEESREVGPEGVSGSAEGSRGQTAALAVGDTRVLHGGTTGTTRGSVDDEGRVEVDVEDTTTANDPARVARRVARQAAERAEDGELGAASQALAGLRSVLSEEFTHVRGIRLTELDTLTQRAGHARNWSRARAPRPDRDFILAWRALAGRIRHPAVRADERNVDPDVARKLAIVRALANFTRQWGTDATASLRNVMRRWGRRISTDDDIGEAYEWPSSLAASRTQFGRVRSQVRELDRRLRSMDASGRRRHCRALAKRLQDIQRAINDHAGDFDDAAVRTEMLDRIDGMITTIQRRRRAEETRRAAGGGEREADDREPSEPTDATEDPVQAALVEVRSLERSLLRNARAGKGLLSRLNGLEEGYVSTDDTIQASRLFRQLLDVYGRMIPKIQRLRRNYRTAGVPAGEWKVSPPHQTRQRSTRYEPQISRAVHIHERLFGYGHSPTVGALWQLNGRF